MFLFSIYIFCCCDLTKSVLHTVILSLCKVPYSKRAMLQQEVEKMLQTGVIQLSVSSWASPVIMVPKKDNSVRVCVNFRKLNNISKFDTYPMPRAEKVFEQIGQAEIISTLDLQKGQIPLEESSKEKTAFATPFGLYEFNVLPFRYINIYTCREGW